MTTKNTDPFENLDGALTAQQAALAIAMAERGDTSFLDDGGAPAPATASAASATEQPTDTDPGAAITSAKAGEAAAGAKDGAQATDDGINGDNAVVLAKDGKHTIPYAKLEAHRKGEQHWKSVSEAQQVELDRIRADAQARKDAGQAPTAADNMAAQAQAAIEAGADPDLFGDFSEAGLRAGILRLVDEKVNAAVGARLAPLEKQGQQSAHETHLNAIYSAHKDADSIVESSEFKAFVESHPRPVREAYWKLFDEKTGGTAQDIVEVFTAYKNSSHFKGETTKPATSVKDAAAAALASVDVQPPASLSSIPGGRADGRTVEEQIGDLDGPAMLAALEGKGQAYVDRFLNTRI